jgi:hypothetical protein
LRTAGTRLVGIARVIATKAILCTVGKRLVGIARAIIITLRNYSAARNAGGICTIGALGAVTTASPIATYRPSKDAMKTIASFKTGDSLPDGEKGENKGNKSLHDHYLSCEFEDSCRVFCRVSPPK